MKKIHFIVLGAIAGIAIFVALAFVSNDSTGNNSGLKSSSDTLRTGNSNRAKYFSAKMPDQVSFAGESVPLNDFEVKERLDRELNVNGYWHSSTIQNLKLGSRWFPIIEKILKENNIPDDFKYLAMAESGLRNVQSPAEAHGYWQFLKGTAEQYKLRVNSEVDERYDMEKATLAATKYLKDAYAKFGNWTLSAASYNAGMGAVESALNFQKQKSYYDLYFREETSRYIFRAIAYKIIYENREDYGFTLSDEDLYLPLEYKTLKVTTSIPNLAEFAQAHNTNYKMIKYFNPWLRSTLLTVKAGESYEIRLPLSASVN